MIMPSGGQPVLYPDYQGEVIDWNEFFQNREKHIELMKKGGALPACEGCFWIREREWPERKNEFRYILINVWTKCNLFCIYCDTHSNKTVIDNTKEYNISNVIKDMIEKKVVTQNTKIDIAGGEATLDKNFNSFLSMLLTEGIKNININTNATIYTPSISAGIRKGAVSIITSVDSGTKSKFKYIKKKDLWHKTWENIAKYSLEIDKKNNNSVKTKFIILPGINDSKKEIRNFVAMSKKANVTEVILNIDQNWVKNNSENADEVLRIYELTKYFIKISSIANINWSVWAHIEDLFLRHNSAHADKAVNIDLIFNKNIDFSIKNEKFEQLLLNLKKLF